MSISKEQNIFNFKERKKPKTIKFKLIIIIIILIILIFCSIITYYIIKRSNIDSIINYDNILDKPNLNKIKLINYNDDTKCNINTPKLNENFKFGEIPIRGVNLGGWLVLEPFITPSLFESYDLSENIIDEHSLCKKLGKQKCQKRFIEHYETFVTEQDIKRIADYGLNFLRIPIGHWAIDINDKEEPYVYGAFYYLLNALQWARKYGLRVMIEFHTAPGSQNGWNHSGK